MLLYKYNVKLFRMCFRRNFFELVPLYDTQVIYLHVSKCVQTNDGMFCV